MAIQAFSKQPVCYGREGDSMKTNVMFSSEIPVNYSSKVFSEIACEMHSVKEATNL